MSDRFVMPARGGGKTAALLAENARLQEVLEEIAYGAPWGGPPADHIAYMRKIADDALEGRMPDIPREALK